MSDFLTELRSELLDAHAAHRRRRPRAASRAGASALTRRARWPWGRVVAALVVAVLVVRAVVPPPTAAPRVVDVIRVGGNPTDAVLAGGSVWVSDFAGRRVIRLEPASRRVVERVAVGGQPVAVAAGRGGIWVRTAVGDGGAVARVGERTSSTRVGYGATLAVGTTAVWAADVELGPERIHRIDAGTGRDAGVVDIPGVYALATGGEALWAVTGNGTVLRLDGRTGAVRARWPAIAISAGTADPALVGRPRRRMGAASRAGRRQRGHPPRGRPHRPPPPDPAVRRARCSPWRRTAYGPSPRTPCTTASPPFALNAGAGSVTARVDLGARNPTALLTGRRRDLDRRRATARSPSSTARSDAGGTSAPAGPNGRSGQRRGNL